ncbi:hypothetical protein Aoki45_30830 [Algoriphagus sp. oki45]|uniref:hypothetical protein n=1 Tax=Algoriphagus sp. oki45 TaxID=3067294 RepID=UPI0027E8513D|nr:hypothetical protein Aoki45_30830 [Algoriphagus sp. oki45]
MKQQELIKLMGPSAIDFKYLLLVCFLFCFFFIAKGQGNEKKEKFTNAQYEFLRDVFSNNSNKKAKIYFESKDPNSWMGKFFASESEKGIGTCMYEGSLLKNSIIQLKNGVYEKKDYDTKRFPQGIIPVKNSRKKKGLHISEPLIVETYSFLFVWDSSYEAIEIYHKGHEGNWKFKCFVILKGDL